jgi:hypothetical protein
MPPGADTWMFVKDVMKAADACVWVFAEGVMSEAAP